MSEKKDDSVTLKISADAHQWISEEQLRLKKVEHRKPSHAEIFDRMRERYENRTPEPHATSTVSDQYQTLIAEIFAFQDEELTKIVKGSLEGFRLLLERAKQEMSPTAAHRAYKKRIGQ